jgi:probable phosphoglycerate mutase
MTILLLVRHVEHILQNEVLLGRTHDAPFTERAGRQLKTLTELLSQQQVTAIHSSPRRRALETAQAIAATHNLAVEIRGKLDELDYGEWSGCRIDELEKHPQWRRWNRRRSAWRPPNGESMRELQDRMLEYAAELGRSGTANTIVAVTHAEPIRALMLYATGTPLDDFMRINVRPGSVTRLEFASNAGRPQFQLEAVPA